jgi:hypothetical protein
VPAGVSTMPRPHPKRRRKEPYFKVQYLDPVTLAWTDRRREAFDTMEEALNFVREAGSDERLRIVEFKGGRSVTVHEHP